MEDADMANWAMTTYIIEGPQEDLQKIYEAIKNPSVQEGSSPEWEGNILNTLGIKWDDKDYYMRGFIYDEPELDNILTINAEEAYGLTDFRIPLKKHFPNIKIYWNTESIEDDVFTTNDIKGEYFQDRFYVSIWTKDTDGIEYFGNEENALKYISNMTKGKINSIEDIEKFNKENYNTDQYIILREYSVIKED